GERDHQVQPISMPQTMQSNTLPVIVTVIEAGPLEYQVCLLAESIRLWGGRLSRASIIAVNPRSGPDISSDTERILAKHNVEYRRIRRDDGLDWFPYLNKTAAIAHVAQTYAGIILWLDADIIVLEEPSDLILEYEAPGAGVFAACAPEKSIGTSY